MAEWFKAHAWKACWGVSPSRVRIPLPPPFFSFKVECHVAEACSASERARFPRVLAYALMWEPRYRWTMISLVGPYVGMVKGSGSRKRRNTFSETVATLLA